MEPCGIIDEGAVWNDRRGEGEKKKRQIKLQVLPWTRSREDRHRSSHFGNVPDILGILAPDVLASIHHCVTFPQFQRRASLFSDIWHPAEIILRTGGN